MAKLTEYPKATSFDPNDILIKDGINGTKKIEIEDFIADVSDTTSTTNGKLAKAGDVAELKAQTTLPEEALAWLIYKNDMYVKVSDGKTSSSSSGLAATAYVDVSGYRKIKYRRVKSTNASPSHGMAFYTSGLDHISSVASLGGQASNGYADELYEVDVPATAKYAMFTFQWDKTTYGEFTVIGSERISSRVEDLTNASDIDKLVAPVTLYDKDSVNWQTGYIIYDSGNISVNDLFKCTDFIDVENIQTILYTRVRTSSSSSKAGMAFYDENLTCISGQRCINSAPVLDYGMAYVDVPETAKYARFTKSMTLEAQGKYFLVYDAEQYDNAVTAKLAKDESDIAALQSDVESLFDSLEYVIKGTGFIRSIANGGYGGGSVNSNTETFNYTDYIDIRACKTIKYKRPKSTNPDVVAGMAFYAAQNTSSYISGIANEYDTNNTGYGWNTASVPEGAQYARFSVYIDTETYGNFEILGKQYVSDTAVELAPLIGSPTLYLAETPTDPDFNSAAAASGGTTYADIYDRYDALCTAYPKWLRRDENIGSDSENYPIAHYTLRMYDPIVDSGSNYSDWDGTGDPPSNLWTSNTVYRRVLLSAGVHGAEKAGVLALYYLTKGILTSSAEWARYLRSNAIIEIIPIICPGNFNANRRNNINDVNVNRDYFTKTSAEAQAMTTYIDSISADLHCALDFHTAHGKMGFVAVPPTNPKIDLLLTMANQTFAACVDNWGSVTTALNLPDTCYPYAYANISANQGTFPDYINGSGITHYACTVETPTGSSSNSYTSEKAVAASKLSMDVGCNLLQRMLAI